MKRRVDPEWLDTLPPEDPRAIHSRNDLVRINRCMRHASIMSGALRSSMNGTNCIIELGAGDGRFLLSVAKTLSAERPRMTAALLDRQRSVPKETLTEFNHIGWQADALVADAFDWLREPRNGDVLIANLFLHHFEEPKLAELLGLIAQRANLFIALEPERAAWPLFCSRLLWGIGCNDVTRHDATISVRAGFSGDELTALWPVKSGWRLSEQRAGGFSHLFIAEKIRP